VPHHTNTRAFLSSALHHRTNITIQTTTPILYSLHKLSLISPAASLPIHQAFNHQNHKLPWLLQYLHLTTVYLQAIKSTTRALHIPHNSTTVL
jgi:hypothetical protein